MYEGTPSASKGHLEVSLGLCAGRRNALDKNRPVKLPKTTVVILSSVITEIQFNFQISTLSVVLGLKIAYFENWSS